jgi:UDP-GlcNAc:undecaprenyl-phosphate GlcNAc-1-phosphate transferase
VLSLPAFENGGWRLGVLAPLLIFAYPLTDLFTAVIRRILRGKSPFAADKAHLHHRICAIGVSKSLCVWMLWGLTLSLGATGVLLGDAAYASAASIASLMAVLLMTVMRRFLLHFAENS